MNASDTAARFDLSGPSRRNRIIAALGVILAFLLLGEIGLQFALRLGWRTYRGLDGVSAIAVDGDGGAWALGYLQGRESLMTYTENGSRVEVPLPVELTQAHPITLMIDRQDRAWVGTDFGMIGMRDTDGAWILFSPENYGSDSTRQIIMDGQGRVWARSHRGPAELDPASGDRTIRYASSGMANSDAVALATDRQGQLWALTGQREVKVLEDNGNWRTVVVVPGTVRNGFVDATLTFDMQGQMWLATVQGVGVLSADGAWTEHPLGDPYAPLSLRGILTDAEGRVWVADFEQGIFLFDPQTGWTNYARRNSGLRSDIHVLALDPQGQVWLGSTQGSVTKFDPATSLPVAILPAVRFGTQALLPGVLISLFLLAILVTVQGRPDTGIARQIREFSLGFVTWYAIALLLWGFLRYSHVQSSSPLFFNPLAVLVPVVNLVLMIWLYTKRRGMARGAVWAMVINSMGMLFMVPIGIQWVSTSLFAAVFMMPFFMLG